jgi:hypothetical protein
VKQQTFAQEVWSAIGKIALVMLVCFIGAWLKQAFSTPAVLTIKVISVDYQRGEYTAITRQYGGDRVKIVARCPFACPHIGTYEAGPESMYAHPDLVKEEQVSRD